MLRLTDPRRAKITYLEIVDRIKNYFTAKKAFEKFSELSKKTKNRFPVTKWDDVIFYGRENTTVTGFNTHYVYHTGWAARILAKIKPKEQIDIAGSLFFAGIVSAFIPIKFYDLRRANIFFSGLSSEKGDLLRLPFPDNSVQSISCLHVNEHIGLGRYGDEIDPDGDLKAIRELIRVTAHGGNLLFVVPMGKPRLMFNSARIYSYAQICEYFKELELKEFYLIPDHETAMKTGPIENATEKDADKQIDGCGCFWFRKK